MKSEKKTVLIFTTTYKALYKRDFLQVCCKNNDERVRYGYDKRHLEESLRNRPNDLQDRIALIIFAEYLKSQDEYRYHPIRYAYIKRVDDEIDAISLELELRSFYPYNKSINNYTADVFPLFDSIPTRPRTKKQKNGLDVESHFVLEWLPTFSKNTTPQERIDWKNLVKYLSQLEDMRNISFFRHASELATHKSKSKFNRIDLSQKSSPADPLEIHSGDKYLIRLHIYNGPDADVNTYPTLKLNQNISFGGPYIRQDGASLIECTFHLVPIGTFSTSYSPFVISVDVSNKNEPEAIRSPQIENFLIVKPPNFFTSIVVILFLLGLGLPDVAQFVVPKFIVDNLELQKNVTLSLQIIGSTCLILGSFFGFKKLPLK